MGAGRRREGGLEDSSARVRGGFEWEERIGSDEYGLSGVGILLFEEEDDDEGGGGEGLTGECAGGEEDEGAGEEEEEEGGCGLRKDLGAPAMRLSSASLSAKSSSFNCRSCCRES